jgi:hypothetical protein
MADDFKYDVFLSHSSKDKPVVRAVAERLRADKLRVRFDSWELRAGERVYFDGAAVLQQLGVRG